MNYFFLLTGQLFEARLKYRTIDHLALILDPHNINIFTLKKLTWVNLVTLVNPGESAEIYFCMYL